MEFMLQNHVFPLFRNELGYMRARVSGNFLTVRHHVRRWLVYIVTLLCFLVIFALNATFSQPVISHRPAGCCITSAR